MRTRGLALSSAAALAAMIAASAAPGCDPGEEPTPPATVSSSSSGGGGGDAGPDALPGVCAVDADCGDTATQCGGTRCYDGACGLDHRPMHHPCSEDDGRVCDGAGRCVACLCQEDCAHGELHSCPTRRSSCLGGTATRCGGTRCYDGACGPCPDGSG